VETRGERQTHLAAVPAEDERQALLRLPRIVVVVRPRIEVLRIREHPGADLPRADRETGEDERGDDEPERNAERRGSVAHDQPLTILRSRDERTPPSTIAAISRSRTSRSSARPTAQN